jgi:hypothetical protein
MAVTDDRIVRTVLQFFCAFYCKHGKSSKLQKCVFFAWKGWSEDGQLEGLQSQCGVVQRLDAEKNAKCEIRIGSAKRAGV